MRGEVLEPEGQVTAYSYDGGAAGTANKGQLLVPGRIRSAGCAWTTTSAAAW